MKCKRDTDARSFDHTTLQTMRQQAVKAVRHGQSPTQVAITYGVNERTVFRWLSAFVSGGQTALLAKALTGRPRLLEAKQMNWLMKTIQSKTPQQCKFEFALWTLGLVKKLILERFGLDLSKATVSRLLRTLGFTSQRPLYRSW